MLGPPASAAFSSTGQRWCSMRVTLARAILLKRSPQPESCGATLAKSRWSPTTCHVLLDRQGPKLESTTARHWDTELVHKSLVAVPENQRFLGFFFRGSRVPPSPPDYFRNRMIMLRFLVDRLSRPQRGPRQTNFKSDCQGRPPGDQVTRNEKGGPLLALARPEPV